MLVARVDLPEPGKPRINTSTPTAPPTSREAILNEKLLERKEIWKESDWLAMSLEVSATLFVILLVSAGTTASFE